jgi:hypothetical protein
MKIVSGGQTGVDRAALDAALELGIEAGGWCPQGRLAEDGAIAEKYPLKELPKAGYLQRTKRNVIDSDGTVIIFFGNPAGGTQLTLEFCMKESRPHLLIDAQSLSVEQASVKIQRFIDKNNISILNVAGPRASEKAEAYGYAKLVILNVFQ